MPKPMLKPPVTQMETQSENLLSVSMKHTSKEQAQHMDKMKLDRLLRRSRSKEYMQSIHKLDSGGHTHNNHRVEEIINIIRNEFPDVDISGVLLGFVSVCHLGRPYEVHTLDMTGQIIEHYKIGQTLPNGLEKARSIALHGGYDFIEVYVDCCRCISTNGNVSVISC